MFFQRSILHTVQVSNFLWIVLLFFKYENKLLFIGYFLNAFRKPATNTYKILMTLFFSSVASHIHSSSTLIASILASSGQNKIFEQVFEVEIFGKLTDKCSGACATIKKWKYWITHVKEMTRQKIWMRYSMLSFFIEAALSLCGGCCSIRIHIIHSVGDDRNKNLARLN